VGGTQANTGSGEGELPPGFAVGEYRVERLLGRGGMGAVYAARQPEIDARVAIKVLAAELSRDPRLLQRFVDEARAVNKIRHPNIIDIFSFGRLPDGRHHFVMEYLEGETLAARLARGPLPPTEARRLLLQICEALEAAHAERIVHRDLKPDNLWIATPRHGAPYAKVLDFGIAKLLDERDASLATQTGVAMGTAYYMAPEQCRGEAVDHRADVYSMGVILYEMWTGRLPFEGPSFVAVVAQHITATPPAPSSIRPVPARLERLILRCLEKDPAARPASARELGAELDAILAAAAPAETAPGADASLMATVASGARMAVARAPRQGLKPLLALVAIAAVAAVAWAATKKAEPPPTVKEVAPAPAVAPPPAPAAVVAAPPPAPSAPAPAPSPARGAAAARPAKPARTTLEDRGFSTENPFR
jgi:serine/threonine-protein kinase